MTEDDIQEALASLEQRILACPAEERRSLRPEVHALIDKLDAAGVPVPEKVRSLDDMLAEDEIEAQFDNMPL